MGVYKHFNDSYAREATFGTSAIPTDDVQTYKFGVIGKEKTVHPSPRTKVLYRATGVGSQEVPVGALWKQQLNLTGMYPITMQDGILIQAVMGASSTPPPAGGNYTHTISTPTDGSKLPSFTIQHERTGTASAWSAQFLGAKIAGLTLTCGFDQRYLIGRVDWLAKKVFNPGFQLVNDPVLPPTSNDGAYHFGLMSRNIYMTPEWDDPVSIDGLTKMELQISPDLQPIFAHVRDAGVWVGQWLWDIIEAPRKQYNLTMELSPDSDDMFDELTSLDNTLNMNFTWTRTATNYISMNLLDCQFISHTLTTPVVGDDLIEKVEVEPRSVNFVIMDQIEEAAYGE